MVRCGIKKKKQEKENIQETERCILLHNKSETEAMD